MTSDRRLLSRFMRDERLNESLFLGIVDLRGALAGILTPTRASRRN